MTTTLLANLIHITSHNSIFIVAFSKQTSRNHCGAVTMSGYEYRNSWVFSLRRNTGNDGADVTSSGRLFQILKPAEANERSPTVTSRDGRMSSRLEDADLNRLLHGMSATRCSWSEYRGALPCRRGRRYLTEKKQHRPVVELLKK